MTAKKNAGAQPAKTYSVSQMATAVANAKGISTDKAAKLVRSKLRANFPAVSAKCASVRKAKVAANDGNRWPTDMHADVFAFVVNGDKLDVPS